MFLLVPDPSPVDPQLRSLWDWLQQRVQQCPSTLPDSVLSELVDTLLTRVHCSAASREEVIPIALTLTESFMYQVPRVVLTRAHQCFAVRRCLAHAVLHATWRTPATGKGAVHNVPRCCYFRCRVSLRCYCFLVSSQGDPSYVRQGYDCDVFVRTTGAQRGDGPLRFAGVVSMCWIWWEISRSCAAVRLPFARQVRTLRHLCEILAHMH